MLAATLASPWTVSSAEAWECVPSARSGRSKPTGGPPPPIQLVPCRRCSAAFGGSSRCRPLRLSGKPRLRILSPANGRDASPPGPCGSGASRFDDWPLVGPGPLRDRPHLVVQARPTEPLRLSDPPSDGLAPVRLAPCRWPHSGPAATGISVLKCRQNLGCSGANQLVVSARSDLQPRRRSISCRKLPVAGLCPADQRHSFCIRSKEQPLVPIAWLLVDGSAAEAA